MAMPPYTAAILDQWKRARVNAHSQTMIALLKKCARFTMTANAWGLF